MKGYVSSSSEDEHSQLAASETSDTNGDKWQQDTRLYRPQLHALHRFRRERKKGLVNDKMGVSNLPRFRTSIVNRSEFFFRFGEKEKEACDSFNFLEELSTSTPSSAEESDCNSTFEKQAIENWSDEELSIEMQQKLVIKQKLFEESSDENNAAKRADDNEWQLNPIFANATDEEQEHLLLEFNEDESKVFNATDRISLSDSCPESYYGSDSDKSFRSHEMNFRV